MNLLQLERTEDHLLDRVIGEELGGQEPALLFADTIGVGVPALSSDVALDAWARGISVFLICASIWISSRRYTPTYAFKYCCGSS